MKHADGQTDGQKYKNDFPFILSLHAHRADDVRGYVQKFPDWVDKETEISTCWEATQRVMVAKPTRLTHKIAIQLHLVAESYTICSSRSRRPVRKLFDISSYIKLPEEKIIQSQRLDLIFLKEFRPENILKITIAFRSMFSQLKP
jgi:hypothetical protein